MKQFVISLMLLSAGVAWGPADLPTGIPAERQRLATDRLGLIDVESGEVLRQLQWEFGLHLGVAKDPLVVYDLESGAKLGALVESRLAGGFTGALGLANWFQFAFELPFVANQSGATDFGEVSVRSFPTLRSS